MGVAFTLEIDGRSVTVRDPFGGEGNAAGDFDRLLPVRADFPTLHRIGEYGAVKFTPSGMACIVEEAEGLLDAVKDGPNNEACFACRHSRREAARSQIRFFVRAGSESPRTLRQ